MWTRALGTLMLVLLIATVACDTGPAAPTPEPPPPAATPLPAAPPSAVPPSPIRPRVAFTPTFVPAAPPSYGPVTFSAGFNEQALVPVNPAKTFAYGSRTVFASWTYSNVVPGSPFDYEWYRNGVQIRAASDRQSVWWGRSFEALGYASLPAMPLDAGDYRFLVRVGARTVVSDTFAIQPPVITGTNTLTVFFTVQNGMPGGYVIDKQGIKHTPASDLTISDFYVSIGDRLLLKTDQPGFSLLFDCGTTPDMYSPCDFSAESPAALPTALRKNRNGTATLNVSRAKNWGDPRPDFEPQRYPAEPVLRIVMHD